MRWSEAACAAFSLTLDNLQVWGAFLLISLMVRPGDFLNLMQKSTGLRGLIRERTDAAWSDRASASLSTEISHWFYVWLRFNNQKGIPKNRRGTGESSVRSLY